LHLDHLLGPLQFHLQACDLVPQALQLCIHRQLRLWSSFLRGQGVLLPAGGLPAPGVDVRGVQSLAPQESPSLPLRGRFVLPEHLELVLGLESSSLGLGQYLGVSLRCPVLLCQHASRTFSPSPVIRKVFAVSRTLAQRGTWSLYSVLNRRRWGLANTSGSAFAAPFCCVNMHREPSRPLQ